MNLAPLRTVLAGRLNEAVEELETVMLTYPQVEIPAIESLKAGLYTRRITIPADTVLTGRVWLEDYVDIMVSGHILVATNDGTIELKGYNVLDGKAGRKRAGYAITDTEWITVHKSDAESCEGLLEQLSTFSMSEYKTRTAQLSYKAVFGAHEKEISLQVQNTADLIKLPKEFSSLVTVKPSGIHGLGMFANIAFKAGSHIAPARIGNMRTCAGRYVNHSPLPNAVMQRVGEHVALMALINIAAGEEIVTDYAATLLHLEESSCQE